MAAEGACAAARRCRNSPFTEPLVLHQSALPPSLPGRLGFRKKSPGFRMVREPVRALLRLPMPRKESSKRRCDARRSPVVCRIRVICKTSCSRQLHCCFGEIAFFPSHLVCRGARGQVSASERRLGSVDFLGPAIVSPEMTRGRASLRKRRSTRVLNCHYVAPFACCARTGPRFARLQPLPAGVRIRNGSEDGVVRSSPGAYPGY